MRPFLRRQGYQPGAAEQAPAVSAAVRGVPLAQTAPSQPGALDPERGIAVKLPGMNFPPPGLTPIDVMGFLDIAPAATGDLITVEVPDNLRFRIAGIGFHANDDAALGFLTWSILLDGDASPGYVQQIAAIGSVRQLADIVVLVGSSQVVVVRASVSLAAGITYNFGCRLRGWFYSEKEVH